MSQAISGFRNIVFCGHPTSGKTTLIEALALASGAIDRKGTVEAGTTLSDTEPEEQSKQHTLLASVVHFGFGGADFNLIDTPGYPDFEGETRAAMMAADWVVGVVSAAGGLTYNLRRKLAAAASMNRPRAVLVTHPEAEHVDFEALVLELRDAIGELCVPVLLPDLEGGFSGVHRVVEDGDSPWRKRLMDRVMDACEDEALLERYLETGELTEAELKANLPLAIANSCLIPVLVCAPHSGVGVPEVLDFLLRAGPTPACHDGFTVEGQSVHADPEAPLAGVVFAVRSDPHLGKLCVARIVTGTLRAGDSVEGCRPAATPEKIGGLYLLVGGKRRESVEDVSAGGICAFAKVEGLGVGDSFGRAGAVGAPVDFIALPKPMVSVALHPKASADDQKIGPALHKLEAEDPGLVVQHDGLTHELVVSGLSELHLELLVSRLERRFGVFATTSLPRIAYRETITKASRAQYRHKKQSGGRGQFAEVTLAVRPGQNGEGIVFEDKVVGGSIPRNLIPAVEKGIRELCAGGILTHAEVVDVAVELLDGKFHAVDSDEASFKAAGARAFREAFAKAGPVLLEPICRVEVHVPADHAGTIFSDLTSQRRGQVVDQSSDDEGALTVIQADVPLAHLQTYNAELKSQTAGAGTWSMERSGFGLLPVALAKAVLADSTKRHADD